MLTSTLCATHAQWISKLTECITHIRIYNLIYFHIFCSCPCLYLECCTCIALCKYEDTLHNSGLGMSFIFTFSVAALCFNLLCYTCLSKREKKEMHSTNLDLKFQLSSLILKAQLPGVWINYQHVYLVVWIYEILFNRHFFSQIKINADWILTMKPYLEYVAIFIRCTGSHEGGVKGLNEPWKIFKTLELELIIGIWSNICYEYKYL